MALSNPVKLLWRISLLLYGLSGGAPQSNQLAGENQMAKERQALRQEKSSVKLEAKRVRLELEIAQLELKPELKRLELQHVKREQQIDFSRKKSVLQQEAEQLREEISNEKSWPQALDDLQQEIERLRKEISNEKSRPQPLEDIQNWAGAGLLREAIAAGHFVRQRKFAYSIGAGKPWHVDSHGIIRDQYDSPVGVWGVDGAVDAAYRR